jgi:hypothetical protein
VIPWLLIGLAIALAVAGPVLGLVTFSPERAEAVRRAEAQPQAVVEQIATLRILHPEMVKHDRLDRHDFYVFVNIGLWMYGWGVLLAPSPNSNLSTLSWDTQQLLGMCMIVGASLSLIGSALGLRIGPVRFARRVSDNLLSDLLGDDLRAPYVLGWCGLLSTAVSLWVYGFTIWQTASSRLLGTLGGGLSAMIGLACITLGVRFIARSHRYSHDRDELLAEAWAGIEGQR